MKRLKDLFENTRELVLLAPASALILWILLCWVATMTGRPVAVSLVPLSEFGINLVRVAVCGAFAAMFQASALGYRAPKTGGTLQDDYHDSIVYIVLFIIILAGTSSF